MSGVVLGGVVEVGGSNLARGKKFTASIGSVDSLYPSVYIYIYIYQGFFWPVLTTDIRSCSQCQKVCFFPNLNKKIPNSRNKKKREKNNKISPFYDVYFVVERAGPNSPNDTREITKYCKLPNGNVPLRQFSRIYSRRCRGVCNKRYSYIPEGRFLFGRKLLNKFISKIIL